MIFLFLFPGANKRKIIIPWMKLGYTLKVIPSVQATARWDISTTHSFLRLSWPKYQCAPATPARAPSPSHSSPPSLAT